MAMTLTQWVFGKIAEEAGEVAKEALKGQQFGPLSTFNGKVNLFYLREELLDLFAMVEWLERQPVVMRDWDIPINVCNFMELNVLKGKEIDNRIDKRLYYAHVAYCNEQLELNPGERAAVLAGANRYKERHPEMAPHE